MTHRIAINGFGRIGRTVLRAWTQDKSRWPELDIVAINELADATAVAHLAQYDSTHGRFLGSLSLKNGCLDVDGHVIELLSTEDPQVLPWQELAVDTTLECTGVFSDRKAAALHLVAGASRVLLSQPAAPDVDATVVWGINQHAIEHEHRVISAGSCTTNALCPVLQVLDQHFGIEAGTVTTVHSAMNDQPVLDAYHNEDLRKTRAAFHSIIPVDTGLAVGVPRILPNLKDRLTAHALRVPTLNVSAMDLAVYTRETCDEDAVNNALLQASTGPLQGVLGFTTEPLASCDFSGETCSSVVDANQTQVSAGRLVKILIWFDNEWAYAHRLLDISQHLANLGPPGAI